MVDLQADRSIVKGLLARGEDVYIIDWGYPDRSDRYLTLEDYIERFLGGAVDHLRRASGLDAINLLGICQGGAFSLCYASLHPGKIRNLVTMVTPVDFHTADNMLSNWVREMDVDLFVDTLGNVPADLMNYCYLMLKPFRLNLQKYVGLVDILDDKRAVEDFLRMEKWIFDSPDQAGEAFRQFIKQFYQGNGFVNGGITIGEREVHLGLVEMPVLNIYAEQDHLVPPDASRALKDLVGSDDYTELSFRGGHIGIYVSGRAQVQVPQTIHDWLAQRS
jgi:polyhydroxyalkanoate synthase